VTRGGWTGDYGRYRGLQGLVFGLKEAVAGSETCIEGK